MNKPSYDDYVRDEAFLREYNAYQEKYARNVRESDKVLINLVRTAYNARPDPSAPFKLLDIGCSTGNLLLHLKNLLPGIEYVGGELAESSLALCRANPALSGITFEKMDMLDLDRAGEFDVIIANAVAVYFFWDEYARAAQSCCKALKKGGQYFAFEWLHPFSNQDIVITETTLGHPDGLRICFRPMKRVESVFRQAGFGAVEFMPFELPIDLPKPGFDEEVVSYTVRSQSSENMCFRGTLYQPWCHMRAVRKG